METVNHEAPAVAGGMITWILIIVTGNGFAGVSDVKHIRTTELQCKEIVRQMKPLRGRLGALCVGPNGEHFSLDDVE